MRWGRPGPDSPSFAQLPRSMGLGAHEGSGGPASPSFVWPPRRRIGMTGPGLSARITGPDPRLGPRAEKHPELILGSATVGSGPILKQGTTTLCLAIGDSLSEGTMNSGLGVDMTEARHKASGSHDGMGVGVCTSHLPWILMGRLYSF